MKKNNKKTLILDCDGVLYPISNIPLAEFVGAVKTVAAEFGISDEEYEKISEKTKAENSVGLFNFVYNLCGKDDVKMEKFNNRMVEVIDYSKIERDDELFNLLQSAKENYNIVVLTNNTRPHLEMVIKKKFGKTIEEFGVDCYDVKHQRYKGKFYPKQSEIGMKLFTNKIGVKPRDCILVEDTQRNLDVAKEVGISSVLITEDFTLGKYLLSLQKSGLNANKKENTL
ncbi:MAG: HAD hydrolase-like protein [Lactobacillaceae bacterium]|jgi:FMN phosphatase YigB (HAD superfamily)|nr:HAD hydrolase-like protein [Lactobacillaceae bacterium]